MAPPAGLKWVQGSCACGHVGWQTRPDICGPCYRDLHRAPRKSNWDPLKAKRKTIVAKFSALPREEQVLLLLELQGVVDNGS